MRVADAVEVLEPFASDYLHRGARADGGPVVILRACLEIAGGWLTLDAPMIGEPEGAVRWTYDGGAGGVHAGRWTDAGAVAEWLEANADAIGGAA